jgi:putative phosphonate metabolism protein
MPDTAPRYAIYYAPATSSPLWRFGSAALGYDAATRQDEPFLEHPGFSIAEWSTLTDEPRRYGFHATLKAPFYLADGADEAALLHAVDHSAAGSLPVALGAMKVELLTRFLALVPANDQPATGDFAHKLVVDLDPFRAPLSKADLARRLMSPLTERQRHYLDRYGYPYVSDEFRFHMTLSGPVPDAKSKAAYSILARAFDGLSRHEATVMISDIAVFRQDQRSARFHIIHRARIGR